MIGPGGRAPHRRASGDGGQSTVELALVLPGVTLLVLLVVQVAMVLHDRLLVDASAREAVRAAAVSHDPAAPARAGATGGLDRPRLQIDVTHRAGAAGAAGSDDELVEVQVRYRSPTDVPVVGALLPDVDLEARATMRVEGS